MVRRALTLTGTSELPDSRLGHPGTVLFDDPRSGNAWLFSEPVDIVQADRVQDVPLALQRIDQHLEEGRFVAGYLAYEAGFAFEPDRFRDASSLGWASQLGYPLVWFGVYTEREPAEGLVLAEPGQLRDFVDASPGGSYQRAVRRIRALIADGEVYQINHTTRFQGSVLGNPIGLYTSIRARQSVEFGAYLNTGETKILSWSPELFFRREGRRITAKPMKGTAPRGGVRSEDLAMKTWLAQDEKNRAENLMIVDMIRNDLSRVCQAGSVTVDQVFAVEELPTLFQMTSTVQGELQEGVPLSAIMQALFPSGSITGAPKIRAMRYIQELEDSPRGVYCGAIGFAGPSDQAVFSVAIRTATVRGDEFVYGAGGGIVWDSDPDSEYEEARLKTRFLIEDKARPFGLIETMRWDGGIRLLQDHLDRLEASSKSFGYPMDRDEVLGAIQEACAGLVGPHRVRLVLDSDGEISVETRPYQDPPSPVRIGLAHGRVSSSDPLLRHKTTRRSVYDRAQAQAADRDLFDVLLTNERGEITEGGICNFFARIGGEWITPPAASGLLPGVGRKDFMRRVTVREAPLTPQDLAGCDSLVVTNAVIGAIPAVLEYLAPTPTTSAFQDQ